MASKLDFIRKFCQIQYFNGGIGYGYQMHINK